MSTIKFTETVFSNKGKKGILKPDENGYYTVILGALNVYNSAGEYYKAEGALELFKSSSHLMRRIESGALYSELGHPKKLPGMTNQDYYNRIITLNENNLCGHISEITLDHNYGKEHPEYNNPDMIAIIGKVKPSGEKANALELSLSNPKENTAFSVRGLTENEYVNGRIERVLTNIITWDFVVEPGIHIANKACSPSLEDFLVNETIDITLNKKVFKSISESSNEVFATEDSKYIYEEIYKSLYCSKSKLSSW